MTSESRALVLVHPGAGVTSDMKTTSNAGPRLTGSAEWAPPLSDAPGAAESTASSLPLRLLRQASTDSSDQIITVSSSEPDRSSLASSLKSKT